MSLPIPVFAQATFFDDFNTQDVSWTGWTPTGAVTPGNGSVTVGADVWTVTSGGVAQQNAVNAGFTSGVTALYAVGGVVWVVNVSDQWYSWNGSTWVAGGAPVPNCWIDHYPFGGNEYFLPAVGEQEYLNSSQAGYTSSTAYQPFSQSGSTLTITATTEVASGVNNPANQTWNSGGITSCHEISSVPAAGLFAFQYGYVEIKCKVPAGGPTTGPGFWPACALYPLGNGQPGEIDIFEILGGSTTVVRQTIHNNQGTGHTYNTTTVDTSLDFHTYGVDWQQDFITFYVDGVQTGRQATTSDMQQNQWYINVPLAVGGPTSWGGGLPSPTVAATSGALVIDYIGVWSNFQSAYPPSSSSATITINPIATQNVNTPFTVSGTFTDRPAFNFADDNAFPGSFPSGATEPATPPETWSFTHPGFPTAGSHTITVNEAVSGASASITVNVVATGESPNGTRLLDTTSGSITDAATPPRVFTLVATTPIGGGTYTPPDPYIPSGALVANVHPNLTAWAAGNFTAGQRCSSGGNAYECTGPGNSTVAPSGTGSIINSGTATFRYLSAIDFTSEQAWADTLNNTTLTNSHAMVGWNNGLRTNADGASFIKLYGINANGHEVSITAAKGDSVRDHPDLPLWFNPANGCAYDVPNTATQVQNPTFDWYIDCDNVTIDGWQFRSLSPNNLTQVVGIDCKDGRRFTLRNCLIEGHAEANDCEVVYFGNTNSAGTPGVANMINCVLVDHQDDPNPGPAGMESVKWDFGVNGSAINCTFVATSPNAVYAIKNLGPAGETTVKNCLFFGYREPLISQNTAGSIVADHCVTDVASFSAGQTDDGTTNKFSKAAATQFVDPATDLRLKAGADAIGAAVTDTTDIPAADGLFGRPRGTTWDAGCHQFNTTASSGGNGAPFQIAINGATDSVTGNVDLCVYWHPDFIQRNTNPNWYTYGGTPGNWGQLAVSASGTELTSATGYILTSAQKLVTLTAAHGQIMVDGVLDTVSADVTNVLVYNGALYQANGSGSWFTGSFENWTPVAGDPRTTAPPPGSGFTTQGASIIGPDGNPFTIKSVGLWEGYSNPCTIFAMYDVSWQDMLQGIKNDGFNTVRLGCYVTGINAGGWPINSAMFNTSPDLNGLNTLQFYDMVVDWLGQNGMYAFLDIHSTVGGISTRFSSAGFSASNNGNNWSADGITQDDYYAACTALGTRYAGKPAFLGVDMCNEPWLGDVQWDAGSGVSLRNMYTVGGNAIHAAVTAANANAPLPLIICQSDVQGDHSAYASQPVVLNHPNKVVANVHAYPSPWGNGTGGSGNSVGDSGPATQDAWTNAWGYLVAQDIVPVMVGEWGGTDTNTFPNATNYWSTIVPYIAGTCGRAGAPTKRTHWSAWAWSVAGQSTTDLIGSISGPNATLNTACGCADGLNTLLGLAPT